MVPIRARARRPRAGTSIARIAPLRPGKPDYQAIFERRGAEYHEAMRRFPRARDREFVQILDVAGPRRGEVVVDMPSGGGYLRHYLDVPDVRLIAVESSAVFHAFAARQSGLETRLCPLDNVDLESGAVDVIVSLAGLHHLENRPAVFAEMHRLLADEGRLCLADVEAGSGTAMFLNEFVHAHNSMGHVGEFLDAAFRRDLRQAGFAIESDHNVDCPWVFRDKTEMAEYCRLLFGIDLAPSPRVAEGIRHHLGFRQMDGSCRMNWSLSFIRCAPSVETPR